MKQLSRYSDSQLTQLKISLEEEINYRKASILPSIVCQASGRHLAVDAQGISVLDADRRCVSTFAVRAEELRALLTKACIELMSSFRFSRRVRIRELVFEIFQKEDSEVDFVAMTSFSSRHITMEVVCYSELISLLTTCIEGKKVCQRTTHPTSRFPVRKPQYRNYRKLRRFVHAIQREETRRKELLATAATLPSVGTYQRLAISRDYVIFSDSEGHADTILLGAQRLQEILTHLPEQQEQAYQFGEEQLFFEGNLKGFSNSVVSIRYEKTRVPAFFTIQELQLAIDSALSKP